MGVYIGVVEYKNYFYNFKPIAEIIDSTIKPLSSSEQEALLPESKNKNINLRYNNRDPYENNAMQAIKDKELLVFQFSLSDLEDNYNLRTGERNPTGYCVQAVECLDTGKIKPIYEWGVFYVIKNHNLRSNLSFRMDASVEINLSYLRKNDMVYVEDDDFYAGPFEVGYNDVSSSYYIKPKIKEQKYTVYGHSKAVINEVLLDSNSGWMEPDLSWSIIMPPVDLPVEQKDLITDKDLMDEFQENMTRSAIENGAISLQALPSIIEKHKDSVFSGASISEEIQQSRLNRICELFAQEIKNDQINKQFAATISGLLVKYQSDESVEAWIEALLKDHPDFLEQLRDSRAVRDSIEKKNLELESIDQEIESKKQQIKDIDQEIKEKESEKAAIYQAAKQVADEELQQKNKEAKEQLDKNIRILGISNDTVALQRRKEELEQENSHLEWWKQQQTKNIDECKEHITDLENQKKTLESEIKNLFDEYIEQNKNGMMSIAFDGFRSSKMLQAAARWEQQEDGKHSAEVLEAIKDLPLQDKSPKELVDYLYNTVRIVRPLYSKNTIVNIAICLTQGFLTIFSGEPGCGKTSICNIFGKVLGLDSIANAIGDCNDSKEVLNRYVPVSVERGWSSKRDFVGYYNPLSKQYDKSNRKIYNALKLLNEEKRQSVNKLPCIVLLDEANLSPMEYYWSDFMNICDDLDDNSEVNLGEDYVFGIPETLHFFATINNDQTTETLSPRLIDRAWIISLPSQARISAEQKEIEQSQIEIISWASLKNAFQNSNNETVLPSEVSKVYEAITARLREQRLFISNRVDRSIRRYWGVAWKYFDEDETNTDPKFVALDYAVAQRILPKIVGSGEQFGVWLEDLKNYCSNQGLNMTKRLLEDIIERGDRQMKYYNFFC